jgi:signal transduction histidine kinase
MLPKNVLHKRNGHRHPPRPGIRSAGEILGLVHRDPDRASELSPDLVRFGAIVQSERPDDQWEQIVAHGMSLPSALARALTRTREAFERGELADLHVALEGLRAQASAAAEMIARLTDVARSSERTITPEGGRCLLSINDVVLHALATTAAAGPVSSQLDPRLPLVVADPEQLNELLTILLDAVANVRDAGGRPGTIVVQTSHHDGVMRGERVVRVLVTDDDAAALDPLRPVAIAPVPAAEEAGAEPRLALHRAAGLAREHGGVFCTAALPGGGVCYTLDLPAA